MAHLLTQPDVWQPIDGFPGWEVANTAKIRRARDGFMPKISLNKSTGYYRVNIPDDRGYHYMYLHRLLARAFIPNIHNKPFVDHLDGDRTNNALVNLRWATRAQNMWNMRRHRDNTSGFKGVHFNKARGKWQAYISVDGRRRHLGYFDSAEKAGRAFDEAARHHHGEFSRTNADLGIYSDSEATITDDSCGSTADDSDFE